MLFVDDLAVELGTTLADVQVAIVACNVDTSEIDGRLVIFDEAGIEIVKSAIKYPEIRTKIETFSEYSDYIQAYHPEILHYLCHHNVIDIFCWLLKLRYSSREVMKNKRYCLDSLFDDFLLEQNYSIKDISKLIGANSSAEKFVFHLKKGWYHEAVRSYPLNRDMLNIGTRITGDEFTEGRFLSWNITESYYAVYEFINALVFTCTNSARTEQHKATTNLYENGIRERLTNHLIAYPFNITSPVVPPRTINSLRGANKPFWGFKYATCPRARGKSIFALESDLLSALSADKNLTSFLYNFRVWANYQGIEAILDVQQDGYLVSYLYRNLGVICFFYACFAELMGIALLGEKEFIHQIEDVGKKFLLRETNFRDNWYLIPPFMRLRFYRKHGLISSLPDFALPPSTDPIRI